MSPLKAVAKQNRAAIWRTAKNARIISLPSLPQNYVVVIATSLDKLENKVKIHHWHV